MLRQNDPVLHQVDRSFWEYVEKMDGGRMSCKFCGHEFAKDTSISRIKFHLARVKGHGVRICEQVPQDVQDAALAAIPIDGPPEKKLKTVAGSSNNEVTNAISASAQEQNNNEVIMDDVHNVVKEKTEPIASMLDQSNAILDKLSRDDGRIQVGVQGLEQGAKEELICLHPEAESGMENTCAEYIQHVDRNDSLEQTRLMESNSGRLVQPGTSASSTKLAGRASVKNAIWSCLMDDKVSIIGIYGMGGNGKTTMLKNICNELLERQDISHSIYWVNVPQDFRIDRSQDLIAKRLDLNLPSKDDDLCGVVELAKELMMKQKWILILNDLWNSFDPQEFGIPVPLNGSKFIMTTRSEMVCQQMNCQNSIRVDPLSDEEAWTLFMEKLGHDRQLSQEEKRIAVDAARECAGLPLGIVTLAESLKGVHELHKWKITLKRLKESIFWEMEDQIFQILRLSYDCLDDSTKECFVYCALFDESQKIERRELIESFIGEGIIKEYDKGHSILDELENVCLLERIDDGSAVKMHDLLRDMAIQILDDEYSPDMQQNNEMMMAQQREDLSLDEDWMASITAEDMEPLVRGSFHERPSFNQADEPRGDASQPTNDQLCSPSINNDVIVNVAQNVGGVRTEPVVQQSNAGLDNLSLDAGRTQVGVQGMEQGGEEGRFCSHLDMENTGEGSVQHVPTIDENYNRREATERLVQPGVGASSFGVCGNHICYFHFGTKAFPLLFKPPLTSSSLMDTLGGVLVGASAAGVSTLPFDNGGNTN